MSDPGSEPPLLSDMNSSTNDDSDLRQFGESGDGEAFASVVNRHAGLVYHTALRQLRNPSNAEDVSQRVFITLARKCQSGFRLRSSLPSWLFKTTINECSSEFRAQSTRDHYMKAYTEDKAIENESQSAWVPLMPHLDEALARLSEKDRDVVMLKYYQGLGFREIGEVTGKTEAACQRRAHRALAKLRKLIKQKLQPQHYALLSGKALYAALATAYLAKPPSSLAGKVMASMPFNTLPCVAPSSLVTWNARLGIGILTGGMIPLVAGYVGLRSLHGKINEQPRLLNTESTLSTGLGLNRAPTEQQSAETRIQTMLSELTYGQAVGDRLVEFEYRDRKFLHLSSEELKELLEASQDLQAEGLPRTALALFFLRALASKDPPYTLHHVLHEIPIRRFSGDVVEIAAEAWTKQDPAAASHWFETEGSKIAIRGTNEDVQQRARVGMAKAYVSQDLPTAVQIAEALDPKYAATAVFAIAPIALETMEPSAFFELIKNIRMPEKKQKELQQRIRRAPSRGVKW